MAEEFGHNRGVLVWDQFAFGYRCPLSDRTSFMCLKSEPVWSSSARAPALTYVLGHASQALLPAHQAVQLVESPHHLLHDYIHDAVGFGQLAIEDADTPLLAFEVESGSQILVLSGNAGCVHHQQHGPGAFLIFQSAQHRLKSGTLAIIGALHGIGKFGDYHHGACGGERLQFATLGVDGGICSVFTRPEV